MKIKAKQCIDQVVAALSGLPQIECVSLNEAALPDTLDPYFALILDVFHQEGVPPDRRALYGTEINSFESTPTTSGAGKDRFLVGSLPVRVEYKDSTNIEELVTIADTQPERLWLIKGAGTYGYYRLTHGELLFCRSDWIHRIRQRLSAPADGFWNGLRSAYQSKMEHLLNDLGAALLQDDDFNYLISSGLFIKAACFTLFCINRRFEPSHRAYFNQVVTLPVLPEGFATNLTSFLKSTLEMTRERRYLLAQLIARSIVSL